MAQLETLRALISSHAALDLPEPNPCQIANSPAKEIKAAACISPGCWSLPAALFWAGLHEPAALTPVTLLLWGLSAVTAGVLMRAALAVAEPLVKLAFDAVMRAIR